MAFRGLFNRSTDDGFQAAVVTSTVAPLATYALPTLQANDPAQRVLFGNVTVTITWTSASPIRGDLLVIPSWNGTAGMLTNGSGLSVAVPVVTRQANGIPNTTVLDILAAQSNVVTRTATVWNLVVTSNAAALIMGGAVALYNTQRILPLGMRRESLSPRKRQAVSLEQNEYFTIYPVNYTTNERALDAMIVVSKADLDDLEAWYDTIHSTPGFLWPGNTEIDKFFGIWSEPFMPKRLGDADAYEIPLTFLEFSKGKPI